MLKKYEKLLKKNKAKSSKKALKLETPDRPLILWSVDGMVSHKDTIKIIHFSYNSSKQSQHFCTGKMW